MVSLSLCLIPFLSRPCLILLFFCVFIERFQQGESTILDMDLVTEEKSSKSSTSSQLAKPGKKRKQFQVSVHIMSSSAPVHLRIHHTPQQKNCFSF